MFPIGLVYTRGYGRDFLKISAAFFVEKVL